MGYLVGRSLAHFRIDAELGEGGMGVVYRATDEKLGRQVALKVLPESFAQDEDRRRRFLREARSAAAITHANIATVYEVGEADGHIFIAMELVEGETLRARIERGVSVPDGVRIAKDIARGLGRAHEKGIIHRDLKPENVMVSRYDEVKILDFGLAKLRESTAAGAEATTSNITSPGRLLGTPAYMSPEQARGVDVDARTDVFSFGVVLYEMVAGGRPFVGQTTQDVITSILRDTPARPTVHNPLVPEAIEHVIELCLEKEPDARYASGGEVLNALSADVPQPPASQPSSGHKAANAPTVSLDTPGPSTVGAKNKARWRLGLALIGALSALWLVWEYQTRGTSGISASNSPSGSTPATVAAPIPFPAPPLAPVQVPEAAAEPSGEPSGRTQAASVASPAPAASVSSKRSRQVPPPVSATPSVTRAPPRPESYGALFETQD